MRAFTECVARISWCWEMKVQEYNCATRVCVRLTTTFPFTSFFTSIDKKQKPSRQANDEQKIIPIEYTGVSERKERKI